MSAEFEKTVLEELRNLNNKIDVEISSLRSEIKDLKHSYEVMNQSIILIEHTVTFEIPALLDGYKMSHDMQEIQHNRLNSLSFKVEDHDNRISILELNAK